jgi:hypothetical protein
MDKVDLQVEYKDFFEGLGDIGTYTYKFFDLFKVNLGNGEDDSSSKGRALSTTSSLGGGGDKGNKLVKGLHWSKDCSDEDLSDEQLKELKTYLKQVKSWIRKEQKNIKASECRRKMWFFMQKLLEYGAFTRGERREMILWMDNFNFLIGVKIVHNQDD